jgi:hypothetical protein
MSFCLQLYIVVCFAMLVLLLKFHVLHLLGSIGFRFTSCFVRTTSWPSQRQTYSWTTRQLRQPKSLFAGWCGNLWTIACSTECLHAIYQYIYIYYIRIYYIHYICVRAYVNVEAMGHLPHLDRLLTSTLGSLGVNRCHVTIKMGYLEEVPFLEVAIMICYVYFMSHSTQNCAIPSSEKMIENGSLPSTSTKNPPNLANSQFTDPGWTSSRYRTSMSSLPTKKT